MRIEIVLCFAEFVGCHELIQGNVQVVRRDIGLRPNRAPNHVVEIPSISPISIVGCHGTTQSVCHYHLLFFLFMYRRGEAALSPQRSHLLKIHFRILQRALYALGSQIIHNNSMDFERWFWSENCSMIICARRRKSGMHMNCRWKTWNIGCCVTNRKLCSVSVGCWWLRRTQIESEGWMNIEHQMIIKNKTNMKCARTYKRQSNAMNPNR